MAAGEVRKKKGKVREYVEALVFAGVLALLIRSFIIEAFKIPSGSMIPTISIGDHIFVNKFVYGLRIPLTKIRFFAFESPQRGDVVVFIYPVDESKDFIKRVVGLPGDRILLRDDTVMVNGEPLVRVPLRIEEDPSNPRRLKIVDGKVRTIPYLPGWRDFHFYEESHDGKKYVVQYERYSGRESYEIIVPPGSLFVMGDNRDNSADSREWGFVPQENIKGQAMFVWLSLDHDRGGIRWQEFGRWVK